MESFSERTRKIIDEFQALPDWEARYRRLIEIGKTLPELPEELKTSEALVKGCQSQVWLHANLDSEKRMRLRAESDALLVRGLIALLLRVYDGLTPSEILGSSPDFLREIGFQQNLTPSRANGLSSMLKQIHHFAFAFDYMTHQKKDPS